MTVEITDEQAETLCRLLGYHMTDMTENDTMTTRGVALDPSSDYRRVRELHETIERQL